MEITEPRRLYQQLAADLKERIEQGVYLVGDKLPAERFIADEKNVSRTVVREAISWAIPALYKTGYLIYPRIIINAHTIFFINTVYRRC